MKRFSQYKDERVTSQLCCSCKREWLNNKPEAPPLLKCQLISEWTFFFQDTKKKGWGKREECTVFGQILPKIKR